MVRELLASAGLAFAVSLVASGCAGVTPAPVAAVTAAPRLDRTAERARAPVDAVPPPAADDDLNPGELFAVACGTSDFDACVPLTPERLPSWERAIAANRAVFGSAPSSAAGMVAGVRAATGLDVTGAPAEAADLFRAVADAYAGDAALAPLEGDAMRGVDSVRAEYDARVAVLAPLLEHAAAADLGALALDRALGDWERIAGSPRLRLEVRAPAAIAAMKLARSLGDEAARDRIVALARRMGAPLGTRVELDWIAATFAYARWDARADDVGENQRERLVAAPVISAFYMRWRDQPGAAPWVVEAAWAARELARVGRDPDEHRWLERVGAAWPAARSASTVDSALRDAARDHAALAAIALLDEEVGRAFDGWGASCARLAPGAVVSEYDAKAALADRWATRIDGLADAFAGSPALASWHATSARALGELRRCLATQSAALAPQPPWFRFFVERRGEEAGRLAATQWTLAVARGAMTAAGVRGQQGLALLAGELGNLAVETTVRATLAEAHLRFDAELPGPGAIWMPRGAGAPWAPDPTPWAAP